MVMHRNLRLGLLAQLLGVSMAPLLAQGAAEKQVGKAALASSVLAAELARAVDSSDPKARFAAADALAARKDVDLAGLLTAMGKFGAFEDPVVRGPSQVEVKLWVGDRAEATALHLYVPQGYDKKKPAPLLLIGHGTGGSGKSMLPMWRATADALCMLLVAPSEAGPNGGWAFSRRERESARSAVRYVRRRFNVDENRIYVTGVSRGGHMAWDLALRYPDEFAAIAPMIGGPRLKRVQGQNNMRYIENLVGLPIRDLQGAHDDRFLVANIRMIFRRLKELKARDAKLIEFPELGHSFKLQTS